MTGEFTRRSRREFRRPSLVWIHSCRSTVDLPIVARSARTNRNPSTRCKFPKRGRPTRAEALAKQAVVAEQDALEAANKKIAELERKVGQQALELDFFQQTLRRFKEPRPAPGGPGVNASSRRSKR